MLTRRPRSSRRATSSSRRSSSRASPTAAELARAQLDQRLALADQLERLVEARLAGVQAADDLLDARRGGLVGQRLRRLASRRHRRLAHGSRILAGTASVGEAQRAARSAARAARGRGERLAVARLDERVAALERALRVVAGEREREPLRARAAGARGSRAARRRPCASSTSARCACQAPLGLEPPARAGADLAQLLVQARALALDVRGRARARARASSARRAEHARRSAARGSRRRTARRAPAARAGACVQSTPHGRLGGVRRRRAADGGDVVEQRAVGVVADRGDHRHAQQGDRAAERLVAEAQQVGQRAAAARDDHDVDLAPRPRDRRARARSPAPRDGPAPARSPTPARPAQPRRASAASTSSRALPLSPVITPIVRGSSGRRKALLRLEQALGVELLAQPVDAREQVALAGDAQVG